MIATFIRLENTFEDAMNDNGSPETVFHDYRGIHLVSDNPYVYTQRTYAEEGIELEDNVIEFFDMCGNALNAATDDTTFIVEDEFNDPNTGLPQIIWSLNTANLDFGNQLVYFRLTTGANMYIYSTPFVITADESKYTSQWWYKNDISEDMMSIGINLYPVNKKAFKEVSNYDPVSTGNVIPTNVRITPFERWQTGIIWNDILELFSYIFQNSFIYSKPYYWSGLPVKTSLYNGIESIDPDGLENFVQSEVLLSRDYNYTFDPNAVPVVPPEPPVEAPEIILTSVTRINSNQVSFSFTYDNFSPNYLTYQYSLDGINWTDSTGNILTPHTVYVPLNDTYNYYYRITHAVATSNVMRIPFKGLVLDAVQLQGSTGGTSKYSLLYTPQEYTPTSKLIFEYSADNSVFANALYADGNNNPKDVQVSDLVTTEPYFRIRDDEYGLVSNVIQYTE